MHRISSYWVRTGNSSVTIVEVAMVEVAMVEEPLRQWWNIYGRKEKCITNACRSTARCVSRMQARGGERLSPFHVWNIRSLLTNETHIRWCHEIMRRKTWLLLLLLFWSKSWWFFDNRGRQWNGFKSKTWNVDVYAWFVTQKKMILVLQQVTTPNCKPHDSRRMCVCRKLGVYAKKTFCFLWTQTGGDTKINPS